MTVGEVGLKLLKLEVQQIANALDARVGWRESSHDLWIMGVMSLAHENGRHPHSPDLLDGCEDAELVVNNDIMRRRIPCFYVGQLMLFVHVNQRAPVNRFVKPGALHFAGLEYDVAVGQKNSECPIA